MKIVEPCRSLLPRQLNSLQDKGTDTELQLAGNSFEGYGLYRRDMVQYLLPAVRPLCEDDNHTCDGYQSRTMILKQRM